MQQNIKLSSLFHFAATGAINAISDSIQEYHVHTCLQFKQRTTESDYIRFFSGGGYVGANLAISIEFDHYANILQMLVLRWKDRRTSGHLYCTRLYFPHPCT